MYLIAELLGIDASDKTNVLILETHDLGDPIEGIHWNSDLFNKTWVIIDEH